MKHREWISNMQQKYHFTKDNIDEIIQNEVGMIFMELLEDCGVFKQTLAGREHFIAFLNSVIV